MRWRIVKMLKLHR